MTTNNFTINGIVQDTTKIDDADVRNAYILVGKDPDNVFYLPVLGKGNIIGWGSNDVSNQADALVGFFGARAPDTKDFSIESFNFQNSLSGVTVQDGDTIVFGAKEGTGGHSLAPIPKAGAASKTYQLSLEPTVNVDKARIQTGIWYKFFTKGTQTQFTGACFPTMLDKGNWRGIKIGPLVDKNLLFTFIPINNFVITTNLQDIEKTTGTLSMTAFNTWKMWSKSTTAPSCLGPKPGKDCVFSMNGISKVYDTYADLFGYEFSTDGKCQGTTYSGCSGNFVCEPVKGAMTCHLHTVVVNGDPSSDNKTWHLYIMIGLAVLVLAAILWYVRDHHKKTSVKR